MSHKRQGTTYEVAFRLEALRQGLDVFVPEGDYSVVDCVILNPSGKAFRIQIKGTACQGSDGAGRKIPETKYKIIAGTGTHKEGISATEVDVLACYIEPVDTWYIIPMNYAHEQKSFAFFVSEDSKSKWTPFRDNWSVFKK